jgi:hypothetical protein
MKMHNEADINGDGIDDLTTTFTEDVLHSYGAAFDPSLLRRFTNGILFTHN